MSETNKISVIIPCYNQGDFLKETCNSVKQQTYTNWEAIIVNDGSTDNTENIALKICEADNRFKYLKKENGGLSSARNHGLDNASGDYIQFLDSDDLLLKDKFSKSLSSDADLIVTNFEMKKNTEITPPFCDISGIEITFQNILSNWDIKYSIPIHCALFKTSIAKKLRFNEDLKAKEDWLFWLEFLSHKPTTKYFNIFLVQYRLHETNMTSNFSHMQSNNEKVMHYIYKQFEDIAVRKKLTERLISRNSFYEKRIEDLQIIDAKNLNKIKKYKTLFNISISVLAIALIILIFLID